MAFYEKLNRDGVMSGRELNDWVSPELFAQNCDKLLFLGVEPELAYTAATKGVQDLTDPGDIWWSHGGKLHSESCKRIKFPRDIMAESPAPGL